MPAAPAKPDAAAAPEEPRDAEIRELKRELQQQRRMLEKILEKIDAE